MKITITPAMAKQMLEDSKDFRNRRVSTWHVKWLAGQMKSGDFLYNGEPIIVSNRGQVLDGQHRLHACVQANVEFQTELIAGVDDTVFHTIDTGKKRGGSDTLSICGFLQPKDLNAMLRGVINYQKGDYTYRGAQILQREIMEFAMSCGNSHKLVLASGRIHKSNPKLISRSQASIALYMATLSNGYENAYSFLYAAVSGVGLYPGDPRLALHKKLVANEHGGTWRIAACCIAWNAHIIGRDLKVIKLAPKCNNDWPRWLRPDGSEVEVKPI